MMLSSKQKTQGFTLIELVIVIIVLGVLAATAMPKFSSRSGFEDYTVRDQMIARLRLVQLQGMNADPTNGAIKNACYWVVVKNSCFYQDHTTKNGASCNLPATRSNVCSDDSYNDYGRVTFPQNMIGDARYRFDTQGKLASDSFPLPIFINGESTVVIPVKGDNNLSISIEKEGFIHE